MENFLMSHYGIVMILVVSLLILLVLYFIFNEYFSQLNKKRILAKELEEGISLHFPLFFNNELCKNIPHTYAILLAMKKNNISYKKNIDMSKYYYTITIKLEKEIANKYAEFLFFEIEKLKDKVGREIRMYDVEKSIRHLKNLPDYDLPIKNESNAYHSKFNANELVKVTSLNKKCLRLNKRKLYFYNNNSSYYQTLVYAKRNDLKVNVYWPKQENPLCVKDYKVVLCNEEEL